MDLDRSALIYGELEERLQNHSFWGPLLSEIRRGLRYASLHVAIFSDPFLQHVIEGRKTVDTRLSTVRCAPFGQVMKGDLVLVKETGGPIVALTYVADSEFFSVAHHSLEDVRADHGSQILADDDFWIAKKDARYASLIHLEQTVDFSPIFFAKSDRRGWVSLNDDQMEFAF